MRKPLRGFLCCLPSCFQALVDIVRSKGVDGACGQFRVVRVKSTRHEAAAVDGINGQPALKSLEDSLRKLPIAAFGNRTECKSLRRGRFFCFWPEPPLRGVEFGESFHMELVNYAPRQAFAVQDAVLRPKVGVGHGLELIEFLDGRNVRI